MLTGKQIDRERNLFVGHHVPAQAVQHVVFNTHDAHTLPAQPRCLPQKTLAPPRHNRMKAEKQQKPLLR